MSCSLGQVSLSLSSFITVITVIKIYILIMVIIIKIIITKFIITEIMMKILLLTIPNCGLSVSSNDNIRGFDSSLDHHHCGHHHRRHHEYEGTICFGIFLFVGDSAIWDMKSE